MKNFLVYICTKNDRNGDPRRGWIHYQVVDGDWTIKTFYDEGYDGYEAVPIQHQHMARLKGPIMVPPSEYNRWKRDWSGK